MKKPGASEHVLRLLWLLLLVGGAAYVKARNPDLMLVFLGATAGGWALTRIASEAIESFDALVEWLGEEEEEEEE